MGDLKNYRNITPCVNAFALGMGRLEPPIRDTHPLDYVKTDKRYLVELRFRTDMDLALFERFTKQSPVRLFEYRATSDQESRFFVSDSRMNDEQRDEPLRWVNEELPRIGVAIAMHFPAFALPKCRCIIDLKCGDGVISATTPGIDVRMMGRKDPSLARSLLKEASGALLV